MHRVGRAAVSILAAGVCALAAQARAGQLPPGPVSFSVDASLVGGGDPLHLTPASTSEVNGTLSGSTASYSLLFDFHVNPDPAISGSFTLVNLSGTTQSFTVSATLSGLAALGPPVSIAGSFGAGPDATFTNTGLADDPNEVDGATLASAVFYQARIDGTSVASLGSFSSTVEGPIPIGSTISPESFGPQLLPAQQVMGSIGVAFPGFSLTARDTLVVPFEFVVVPEPSFASLFAFSGAIFLVATRRKFFHSHRAPR